MSTTLTADQAAERQAASLDGNYEDDIIEEVVGPDDSGYYTVTGERGWTFGGVIVPEGTAPPAKGDPYRTYGRFGRLVIGVDLRGDPCWFKTQAERDAENAERLAERKAKKEAEWEREGDGLKAQYDALPEPLRARIDRFVANCPEDWWVNFGAYEMAGLNAAVAIAAAAKESDDPAAAIGLFYELSWAEQVERVPEVAAADSGNLFGYAVQVASMLVMENEDRDLILEWGHGALVPLVGCEAYGCALPGPEVFPKDEDDTEEDKRPVEDLATYVHGHTEQATEGTSVHFFQVGIKGDPERQEFVDLLQASLGEGQGIYQDVDADRLKGGPSYIELGAWIGDQGLALCLMGLGEHLGVWQVITPALIGLDGDVADELAGGGMVMISGFWPEGMPEAEEVKSFVPAITMEMDPSSFPDDDAYQEAVATSQAASRTAAASPGTSDPIDVSGISPPAVLAALYNASHPIGMGVLQARPGDMTEAEAADLLANPDCNGTVYFDYLYGRLMKVQIPVVSSEAIIDPRLYDRDLGQGAAAAALAPLLGK